MRIPTSTIVMGLVTCVPFALAIRAGTGRTHHDEPEEEDAEIVMAREAQMRADEEAAKMRAAESKAEEIHRLYGTQPATPGLLFGGIQLGAPEVTPTQERNARTFELGSVAFSTDDVGLYEISVSLHDGCEILSRKLEDTWGPGATTETGTVWLNPATHTRARFHTTPECELSYDRYATAEEWISKSNASIVPLWVLGQPADKLTDALALPASEGKKPSINWAGTALDVDGQRPQLTANIENGRVVSLVASCNASDTTTARLRDQLAALFGEPKPAKLDEPDGDRRTRWDGKPAVVLERTDAGLRLSVSLKK